MAKCKYCARGEENECVFVNRKCPDLLSAFISGRIIDNKLWVRAYIGAYFSEAEVIGITKKIKYCPMCGRKLQKGET